MTTQVVHFDVQGEWFTWMIRHLWAEGNELKALKLWTESFPDLSTQEHIKDLFIKIVSGKSKFTGIASDPDGFKLEPDNKKFWDPDQSGKENKSFALLDSWEDVILLKKTQLFVKELEFRQFRLARRYPSTFEECGRNTMIWTHAVEENKIENVQRKEINQYLTHIRNISLQFQTDVILELLPETNIPLITGPTFADKYSYESLQQKHQAFLDITKRLDAVEEYFHAKYGPKFYVYSERDLKLCFGITDEDENLEREIASSERTKTSQRETLQRLSQQTYTPTYLPVLGLGVSVDEIVRSMISDSGRERTKPDDPSTTKWNSGYIDREGKLFSCSDLGHVAFSEELCDYFKLRKSKKKDAQQTLDSQGWIKISMRRFFWDESKKVTDEQKKTILEFMQNKQITKAHFNTTLEETTMCEAFPD